MRMHGSLVAVLAALALALGGCGGPEAGPAGSRRPVASPDRGVELDSQDIVTMARKMSEEIGALTFSKAPAVLVMKDIKNETKSMKYLNRISLAKVRAELHRAMPRSKVLFVVERADLERLKRTEGVTDPDAAGDDDPRIKPEYALTGAFHDHASKGGGIYYLCTFQVQHIATGAILWEGAYEVKRVP